MPVFQSEVQFSLGTDLQRVIICGGIDGLGHTPPVTVQSVTVAGKVRLGWFTTTDIRLEGSDVYANLVFTGTATTFSSLCAMHAQGQVDLLATRPFSVALKFQ